MEHKFTDDEIVKALECCSKDSILNCRNCPYEESCNMGRSDMQKDAIDLINRQKTEIEGLNKEVDRLSQCVLYHEGDIIDAIKEFAERLKDIFGYGWVLGSAIKTHIDNLVKEMTNKLEENNNER